MNLPERKKNRLENFDYNENGAYFITICTKNREKILCNIVGVDAHIDPSNHIDPQLTECGRIAEQYIKNIPEVDKYVIMPDHIHLIIRIDNGTMKASSPTNRNVSNIVRSLKIMITKEIGKSIFQRSYYDHIIRNEQDYIETWEYIENNPAKWIYNNIS